MAAWGADPSPAAQSFASYVPESADVYVEVQSLSDLDDLLNRAGLWRYLRPSSADGRSSSSLGLRGFFQAFLGRNSGIPLSEFMLAEVALAAHSWPELSEAVCFVRARDDRAMWRWFPKRRGTTRSGGVIYFRTSSNLFVCARDGVMALSRGQGVGSMQLKHTLPLMQGDGRCLAASGVYTRLRHQLPPHPLAVAYLGTNQTPLPLTSIGAMLPELSEAAVGLYESTDGLRLDIRAAVASSSSSEPVSKAAMARLYRLPQTTLVAALTRLGAEASIPSDAVPSTLGQYLILLRALRGRSQPLGDDVMPPSPHVIVAWDQDLSGQGHTPQVAVMIECKDARLLRDEARRIASGAIRLLRTVEPENDAREMTIQEVRHLGVPIEYVPVKDFAQASDLLWVEALQEAEPAWAVWGDWLVVALTRDHLTRIIDAQHGLAPTLDRFREVRRLRTYDRPQTFVSVVQGGIASEVLDRWVEAQASGRRSVLDPVLWTPQRSLDPMRDLLGIMIEPRVEPGMVRVARVIPGGPGDGFFVEGDAIVGMDDRLLGLESPAADLASRLSVWMGGRPLRVRVLRDDALVDLVLADLVPVAVLDVDPVAGAREFAAVLRAVQLGTYTVFDGGDGEYASRLTVHLAQRRSAKASARGE